MGFSPDLPDGTLLIGGFGDGSLQVVDPENPDKPPTYFNPPGENGMAITVGFAYDESRDMLWVANFNFDTGGGVPGSNLKVFKLNGTLVATVPSDDFVPGVFYNEIALAEDGTVYVSDTFNPTIWMAHPDNMTVVEEFVTDDLLKNPDPDRPFGLNGLALPPSDTFLLASVMDRNDAGDGRLVRIDMESRAVSNVQLVGNDVGSFAGSDGMHFETETRLFMVNVFSSAGAIVTADFAGSDFSKATLTIRSEGTIQQAYNRPTASAVLNGKLWTVNSQLDHIIDDENGALNTPPDLPFQIVGVDLKDLIVAEEATTSPTQAPSSSGISLSKQIVSSSFIALVCSRLVTALMI